ncbi:hypothetical protein [Sinobaca sp. H24]|uniref:hypothetical protein n=1 Tax=Sinobaca sp. H24 TaxID=2923376 RepID=UPI002079D859|nr:hypothetical protein [Sinobaca sp. H24]
MLEQAGSSNDVDGIILKVNTPGGGVVESAEYTTQLSAFRRNTRSRCILRWETRQHRAVIT